MDIDPELGAYIVTLILGIISTLIGDKYLKYKAKATKFAAALKATIDAMEDDKITPEEAEIIVGHWKDIFDEAKRMLEK